MERLLPVVVVALAGCTTVPTQVSARDTYLVCGGAARLDISHDGRFAVVRSSEGQEIILGRTASPLGTKYEAQGVSVLRSGDIYVFAGREGVSMACSPLER